MKRNLIIGAAFLGLFAALAVGQSRLSTAAAQTQGQVMAPRFEVDPTFPKPLPNGWYQGQTIGLWVDARGLWWTTGVSTRAYQPVDLHFAAWQR